MSTSQAAKRRTGERAETAHRLLRMLWLVSVAILAFVGVGNAKPVAANQVSVSITGPTTAQVGVPATFSISSISRSSCSLTYLWIFSDSGASQQSTSATHTFSQAGTFTVTLSVSGASCGDSGTSNTLSVTVGGSGTGSGCTGGSGQIGLTVSAIPNVASVNSPITFNVSTTGATAYSWTFGDGSATQQTTNSQTTHTYTSAGTFTVTVIANSGTLFGCGSTTVTINGTGGTTSSVGGIQVTANGPYTGSVNQPITFQGFAYPTNAGLTITSYTWNFGDGTTGSGQYPTHTYTAAGSYTATLTVTDSGSDTATATAAVTIGGSGSTGGTTVTGSGTVTANGITATITAPSSGSAGSALTFSATATTANPGATITTYNWTFSDGGTATGQSVTHTFSSNGTFTVNLTVFDSTQHVVNATATVSVSGGSRVVNLKQGCNDVALTFPDNTPTGTVLTAVSPQSAVLSIWKLTDPTTGHHAGYFPNSTQASDLTTVMRLDAVSICVNGAATLSEPAA